MRTTTGEKLNCMTVQCFNKRRRILIYAEERRVEMTERKFWKFTLKFHTTGKIGV